MIERRWGDDGVISYECSGTITLQDLVHVLGSTVNDDRYAQASACIWDMRASTVGFDMEEHIQTAPIFLALLGTPEALKKAAWVVRYRTCESIIDIYYRTFRWPQEWKYFKDADAAKDWVFQ